MSGKALLLVGSPAQERSSSHTIGAYLLHRLEEAGMEVDEEFVYGAIRDEARLASALDAMDRADLVIISFPLYVDSLPSRLIEFLELTNQRRQGTPPKGQRLVAICNSGFPEPHQNDCAVRICSVFARESGFHWAGGLSIGEGGGVHGQDLSQAGGMMRHFKAALDRSASALAQGRDIPQDAIEEAAKGFAPVFLYNWIVNRSWRKRTRGNKVDQRARPYE